MKKVITILLTLALVLGLCACGGGTANAKGLQVGFGRVDITPDYEVKLAGGSGNRTSKGFMDYIYVTCIAITESGRTILVYTMDFLSAADVFVKPAKEAISEATGIAVEDIYMCATHTHASVAIASDWSGVNTYRTMFYEAATKAAQDAIADQSAAELYYGSTETENLTFVRHYKINDGTYAGPNFGNYNAGIEGHTTEADTELQIVKFARAAEDKKDIVMMSFPTHSTFNQSSEVISADVPAPTRQYIEKNTDTLVAYFIGAAGDQAPNTKIASENITSDSKEYGELLGQYVVDALPGLTKMENTALKTTQTTYVGKTSTHKADQIDEAQSVKSISDTYGSKAPETLAALEQHGFLSIYEVTAIIRHSRLDATQDITIQAMSVGDISFTFAPYEMFSEHSMYIKEKSPYAMTFMITCADGGLGYLPSDLGFEINCYESWASNFEKGTGNDVADEFVKILTEMKGN